MIEWKRGIFDIATANADLRKVVWRDVRGYVSDVFGIDQRKMSSISSNTWILTHLASGKAICSFNTLAEAKRVAAVIEPMTDWKKKRIPRDIGREIMAAIRDQLA